MEWQKEALCSSAWPERRMDALTQVDDAADSAFKGRARERYTVGTAAEYLWAFRAWLRLKHVSGHSRQLQHSLGSSSSAPAALRFVDNFASSSCIVFFGGVPSLERRKTSKSKPFRNIVAAGLGKQSPPKARRLTRKQIMLQCCNTVAEHSRTASTRARRNPRSNCSDWRVLRPPSKTHQARHPKQPVPKRKPLLICYVFCLNYRSFEAPRNSKEGALPSSYLARVRLRKVSPKAPENA